MSYSMSSPNDWYSLSVFPTVNKIIDHSISDAFAVVASWYFEWQTQDMHLWQGKQVISMKWVYNGCLGCACWKIICHAHIGPLTREQSKMMDSPKARGGFVYGCRKHIWTWQHMREEKNLVAQTRILWACGIAEALVVRLQPWRMNP